MIKELIKLATHLDGKGYRKEADYLDSIIKKATPWDPADAWHDELMEEIDLSKSVDLGKRVPINPGGEEPAQGPQTTGRRVVERVGDMKIYRDYDWDEYIVVPPDSDEEQHYFTNDLEDAILTARHMAGFRKDD
jgi:hypothetical protein